MNVVLCSAIFWFCFFFFKQKTAYEMRISDWSSDVCSSDLELPPPTVPDAPRRRRPVFGGLSRAQILAGLLVLCALIWGMWVTRELVKPRQDRIVAARLSSIVGDYVQAQARSAAPPAPVARSEERRVGKGCVRAGKSRGWPSH